MSKLLVVSAKALEGLNMVNPRQSIPGGVRSGEKTTPSLSQCPGGAKHNMRNLNKIKINILIINPQLLLNGGFLKNGTHQA